MANGDRGVRLSSRRSGIAGEIARAFNRLAAQRDDFAADIDRVADVVHRQGRTNARLRSARSTGGWRATIDATNSLIDDLVRPTDEVTRVISAVAEGDLNEKMLLTIDGRRTSGDLAKIGTVVNSMVDQLRSFSAELTRVTHEVGTEGRLGVQADTKGVFGIWRDLTGSVNAMASNLTDQVRDIAVVTTAVANGDLSQKVTVDVRGEMLDLKQTVNTMVDQLRSFAHEVTRVAIEVGTEGRLGGQAVVPGVSGTWEDLTDSVNLLAENLTSQVRNIAQVTTAVARGDLSQKISVDARGEVAELKETVNTMVDQLRSFADEVTRVAREVGTEGRLGGQAVVPGVSGTWEDLTDNVNLLAGNLTSQVRNIAQVTTAVARGDLSQKISVDARGEVAELKDTINTMVDQLSAFASEVTRVAREVGTEGRLGGQAEVREVSGTWKDLTDNVNLLAGNLTSQVRNIAQVTTAVARGDLSQKISVDARGEVAELKDTINTMVDQLSAFASEVTRVAREVGTEGRLGGQAIVPGVSGTWKDLTDNVNLLAGNLTSQVRNIAQVTTAVAKGDLSRKISVEVSGELLELKNTINTMVDQLSAFADEVTRVAREVGTEGKLGGQAEVRGVSGTWRDLTTSVNSMADNLTDQVRNIADVTTAVAKGDLSQKITVGARGEILELKETINKMVDQLSSFAAEVTRVAREVGTEGRLGGQAEVEGVSGTWARLTENVNQLAGNLTGQVRSIAEVATAVTAGDLSRQVTIDAPGELGDLKDNINRMIENLRATTATNEAQDWLNSNLARISAMMQGQRDLRNLSQLIMSELTPLVGAHFGALYISAPAAAGALPDARGKGGTAEGDVVFELAAGFGAVTPNEESTSAVRSRGGRQPISTWARWRLGEGIVGQAALDGKPIMVERPALLDASVTPEGRKRSRPGRLGKLGSVAIDEGAHPRVRSGALDAAPPYVIALPVIFEGRVLAVMELAGFNPLPEVNRQLLNQTVEMVGVVLNTILATTQTEELLAQSQQLTRELQNQSAELQQKQDELQRTNAEIELARGELEERAEQLALSSRYKSEFLANMSHELRTPLNSLLILARMLADNSDGQLTEKEVGFAKSIYEAGDDLLGLINDILDLSRVEAGKLEVVMAPVSVASLCSDLRQVFGPVAAEKGLTFDISVAEEVPRTVVTDQVRIEQVLKNLLSNACKFTQKGSVELRIGVSGATPFLGNLRSADYGLTAGRGGATDESRRQLVFAVHDTGIGIPAEKEELIFEAFQQADGTTSRRYGGTGLGLSISREMASLLGGELHVQSTVGRGSTFTLVLPLDVQSTQAPRRARPNRRRSAAASGPDKTRWDGTRVVVVDDDVRNLYALASALEGRGMTVFAVDSGRQCLEVLESTPAVDLVLTDVMMPEMDGFETIQRIRRLPGREELPVIAVTAKAMAADREACLAAGASDYVTKPVDISELLRVMRVWLHNER